MRQMQRLSRLYLILPLSFLVPTLFIFLGSHNFQLSDRVLTSVRGGTASTLVTAAILYLGSLDRRLNREPTGKTSTGNTFRFCLGVLLWLVWFSSLQVMFIVTDEIQPIASEEFLK